MFLLSLSKQASKRTPLKRHNMRRTSMLLHYKTRNNIDRHVGLLFIRTFRLKTTLQPCNVRARSVMSMFDVNTYITIGITPEHIKQATFMVSI